MFDMHFHSTISDWHSTTEQILDKASSSGLNFATLTDHDFISPKDFIKKIKSLWIDSKYSVEISARNIDVNKNLHLTCYSNDFSKDIYDILENTRSWKQNMVFSQVKKLQEKWFKIEYNDFIAYFESKWKRKDSLNKIRIAEFIFLNDENIKLAKTISWNNDIDVISFLTGFLKIGWSFHRQYWIEFPEYEPNVELCWELAKFNNAILSIAHPNFTFARDHISGFKDSLPYYIDRWVNAIEISSKASIKWIEAIYEAKKRYWLILTAWSDNHWIWIDDNKHADFWNLNPNLSFEDKKNILKEFLEFKY